MMFALFALGCKIVLATIIDNKHEGFIHLKNGEFFYSPTSNEHALVHAIYLDTSLTTGTGRLFVNTLPGTFDPLDYGYAMGFAEGYLTAKRIIQHVYNMVWSVKGNNDGRIHNFLNKQYTYMRQAIKEFAKEDPFWFNVYLTTRRIDGMLAGVLKRQSEVGSQQKFLSSDDDSWTRLKLELVSLYELNSITEIGEIKTAVTDEAFQVDFTSYNGPMIVEDHCSAIVKFVNNSGTLDLLASHNTWSTFAENSRIYKTFNFEDIVHPSIKNFHISMSSYPGYLGSSDDWFILHNSNLLVSETTISCLDQHRLKSMVRPESVSTTIRSWVANVMSVSGWEWYQTFSRSNSGTYNNQWFILDYKAFDKFKSGTFEEGPVRDIMWLVEQMPGFIDSQDLTQRLLDDGYLAFYNRPYLDEIRDVSGYNKAYEKHGEFYHYDKCPRALLFKKYQHGIKDLEGLMDVMTSNRAFSDDLTETKGCANNAIAGRYDWRSPDNSTSCGTGGFKAYGAFDTKVFSSSLMMQGASFAMFAPPFGHNSPVFSWSEASFDVLSSASHWGQADKHEFGWLKYYGSFEVEMAKRRDDELGEGLQLFIRAPPRSSIIVE